MTAEIVGPQVPSFSRIRIPLADGTELLIISGIAEPDWVINDDGNTYAADVYVPLEVTVTKIQQATITGGLCSIANGHTRFLFSLDSASLLQNPELVFKLSMTALGGQTAISRFSFQAVAIVEP